MAPTLKLVPTYGVQKRSFVIIHGFVFGVLVFLLETGSKVLIGHRAPTVGELAISLVIWLLAGWWYGNIMWKRSRR